MGRYDHEADHEFTGISHGVRGKAILFTSDFDTEDWFVPLSQCDFVPEEGASEAGRGTLFVRAWLARKNGWKNG